MARFVAIVLTSMHGTEPVSVDAAEALRMMTDMKHTLKMHWKHVPFVSQHVACAFLKSRDLHGCPTVAADD